MTQKSVNLYILPPKADYEVRPTPTDSIRTRILGDYEFREVVEFSMSPQTLKEVLVRSRRVQR